MNPDDLSDDDLKVLIESKSLTLKKLPADAIDRLAKRLISMDRDDDVFQDFYPVVIAERRRREDRTAKRKAKREAEGKAWA